MSSIKVALQADDRQFQAALKNATVAADNFGKTVEASSKSAQASLDKLKSTMGDLSTKMQGLGTAFGSAATGVSSLGSAIIGLGMAGFVKSIFDTSSAIKDMATGFGLSIESVLELKAGFDKAGVGSEQMQKTLNNLALATDDAIGGNVKLQIAFEKLGISQDKLTGTTLEEKMYLISDAMIKANGSTESLRAASDLLGKGALQLTGKWDDVKSGIEGAVGTMGPAASKVEALDEANKKMEQTITKIKDAFRDIFGPYLSNIATFISESANAEKAAVALGAAIAAVAGAAVLNAIKTLVGTVTALAGALIGSSAAAANEATSIASNTVALNVNLAARANELRIIEAEAIARIASINALIAEDAALASNGNIKAWLTAATVRLEGAQAGLAAATSLSTGALQAQNGAIATSGGLMASLGNAITAMLSPLRAIGVSLLAVVGVLGAPVWATVAVAIGAITAAVAAGTLVWKAFGDELTQFAKDIWDKLVKAFLNVELGIAKAAQGLRSFFNMKESETLKKDIDDITKRIENIGKAKDAVANKPIATAAAGPAKPGEPETKPASNGPGPQKKPGEDGPGGKVVQSYLAAVDALKQQYILEDLTKKQAEERLGVVKNLVGAGQLESATSLAALDFKLKKQQELAKIDSDIAKIKSQIANGDEVAGKTLAPQLKAMQERRKEVDAQRDTTTQIIADTERLKQLEADRLDLEKLRLKVLATVYGMDQQIADFNRSEDDRKLAAVQAQIKAEQDAAVARRQAQLGDTAIGAEEEAKIRKNVADAMQAQIEKQKELNDEQKKSEAVKFALDLENTARQEGIRLRAQMAELTMSEDERAINALKTQNALLAEQEIARRRAKLAPGQDISEQEKASVYASVEKANAGTIKSTEDMIEKSRDWSTGWDKALKDYASNASNSAKEAQGYFETMSKGIEDAFVSFVQTGKFSVKDLINTMIAQFARLQAQKAVSSIFSGMGSGGGGFSLGGIWDGIKSILPFANGGSPPVGVPSLVGERGPELFVPKSAGTVVPNELLGGSTQQIVQNVSYNIQATDAQSFKQQLARDPSFVHAVVQQGKRSTPGAARR